MKKYRFLSLLLLIPLVLSLVLPAAALEEPEVYCDHAVLLDANHGEVLYDKNAYERAYPASTTKIMTALLVLDAIEAGQLTADTVLTAGETRMQGIPSGSGYVVSNLKLGEQLSVEELDALHAAMAEEYSDHNITLVQANSLKPSMGRNFLIKCLVAVALAAIFLVIYVALRFRKIGGWSAGAMAVAALFHDLLIAFFAFVVFRIPLNDNFVAVLLSILGYSLNATIVVDDRIRENRRLMDAKTPLSEIVNVSLNQSFTRTLNTSICTFLAIGTVAVIALAMNLESIVSFAVPMMFGVLSGFYSSVCLCSPTWVLWQEHRDKKEALKKAAGKKAKA